jgi:tRNA U34 5-methylaminomethyl-2-thiouridine-forming methyltransferase MnmC
MTIFIPQPTQDGSCTFFSEEFSEAFHSSHGAKQEAEVKFIEPSLIKKLAARNQTINILDICYGLGYNTAAALAAIWSIDPQCQVKIIGLEITADVPQSAVAHRLLEQWSPPIPQLLAKLAFRGKVSNQLLTAELMLGDARQTLQSIEPKIWQVDAIFLDPFSPPKCPQLWTVEFIDLVAKYLHPNGRIATYSCAAAVRQAFLLAGLQVASIMIDNRQSPGTVAARNLSRGLSAPSNLPALTQKEREHLKTNAAIPYRDPLLQDGILTILQRRQQEQKNSNLEATSQWKKRWLLQQSKN